MLVSIRQRIERLFPRGIVDVVLQVALLQLAYMAYRLVRGWIDDPQGATIAFQNARDIIGIERSTGLFFEPHLQSALGGGTGVIADVSSWVYLNAQVTVTVGALMFLYLRHNNSFYFVRNMFMVAWCIALVGYMVFPTAPPRFFPEWGFVDSVADFTGVDPTNPTANALFNPYAAVPSMHVAFALMIGMPLSILCKHRPVRMFWRVYPLLVTFVIVMTGNHFLFDAVLGGLTFLAAAATATWMARARTSWRFSPEPARVSA